MGRRKTQKKPAPTARIAVRKLRPRQDIYYGNRKPGKAPKPAGTQTQRKSVVSQGFGRPSKSHQHQDTPTRGRGRPRKMITQQQGNPNDNPLEVVKVSNPTNRAPRRGRGRPRKEVVSQDVQGSSEADIAQKRGRGRPRKEETSGPGMIPIAPSLSAVKLGRGRPRKNEKSRKLSVVPMDSQSCYPTGVKKGRGRPRKRTVSATTHMPQTETSTAHKGIIAEQRSTFPTVTTDSAPITSAIHQTKRGRGRPRKITQLQKRTPSEHSEHDGEHDACHVSADEEHISPRRDYSANYFANELNQTPSLQLRLEQDRSSPKFNEDSEIVDAEQQASDSDGEIRGRRRDPKFITASSQVSITLDMPRKQKWQPPRRVGLARSITPSPKKPKNIGYLPDASQSDSEGSHGSAVIQSTPLRRGKTGEAQEKKDKRKRGTNEPSPSDDIPQESPAKKTKKDRGKIPSLKNEVADNDKDDDEDDEVMGAVYRTTGKEDATFKSFSLPPVNVQAKVKEAKAKAKAAKAVATSSSPFSQKQKEAADLDRELFGTPDPTDDVFKYAEDDKAHSDDSKVTAAAARKGSSGGG